MKRRAFVVVAIVAAQLALATTQALATFPWPVPCGSCW